MNKLLKIALLSILFTMNCHSQKKQTKSIEQECKEFSAWFKTLSPIEKRSASKALVDKLNTMDANHRGLWLATLQSLEEKSTPTKKEVVKKIIPKEMSEEEKISNFEKSIREEIVDEGLEIKSIKPIFQFSNLDVATKYNSKLKARIDSLENNIKLNNIERSKLKPRIPDNYRYDELDYDNQGNYIKDSIKPIYKKYSNYGRNVQNDFALVKKYKDMMLVNEQSYIDWSDDTKNNYLVEIIKIENNGLDDNPEIKEYFKCSYYKPVIDSENSNEAHTEVLRLKSYEMINKDPMTLIFTIPEKQYPN